MIPDREEPGIFDIDPRFDDDAFSDLSSKETQEKALPEGTGKRGPEKKGVHEEP
jgi:hypothetical protein